MESAAEEVAVSFALRPQDAWNFTRDNAERIVRDQWLGFALVVVLAVAIDLWFNRACNLAGFAFYPALVASVRIVRPDFRLDRRKLVALLVAGFASLFVVATPWLIGISLATLIPSLRGAALAGAALCSIWLYVKLSLNQVLYALTVRTHSDPLSALVLSWNSVSGSRWWRLGFAIALIVIATTLVGIPVYLAAGLLSHVSPWLGWIAQRVMTELLLAATSIASVLFLVGFALERLRFADNPPTSSG